MTAGRIWKDKPFCYQDPHSGREVIQLTNYRGHSNHLYFTDPCWIEDNKSFIFTSDRENRSNLFRYDLEDYTITQLTDLDSPSRPGGCFSKANMAHYFAVNGTGYELDVQTLELRTLYEAPDDFVFRSSRFAPTADGRFACGLLVERAAFAGEPMIGYSYSRFVEFFEKQPLTRIIRVDVKTGNAEILFEERRHMGHVNPSPTQAHLLTFCHEGPWRRVAHRIWGLNLETGEIWKIRPQESGEAVGHEYWFADGIHIGYHGSRKGPRRGFFGAIRWDNADKVEFDFPFHSWHFHSNDLELVVGDGTQPSVPNATPFIKLFKREGEAFVGPRILAMHRSTFNDQYAHPHPRFSPDGKHVLYTSDLTGYANMYWVKVGDFYDLPEVSTPNQPTE